MICEWTKPRTNHVQNLTLNFHEYVSYHSVWGKKGVFSWNRTSNSLQFYWLLTGSRDESAIQLTHCCEDLVHRQPPVLKVISRKYIYITMTPGQKLAFCLLCRIGVVAMAMLLCSSEQQAQARYNGVDSDSDNNIT